MYTIDSDISANFNIKNSKFIVKLIKIENNAVKKYLDDIKNEYKSATHYCYAYIYDNSYKYSDDKEPSYTAGIQIYNALKYNNLNKILCIIVRYFGGIKLGTSLLSKTYFNCTIETINRSKLIELKTYIYLDLIFSYDNSQKIEKLLESSKIIEKKFAETIKYSIAVEYNNYLEIKDILNLLCLEIKKR